MAIGIRPTDYTTPLFPQKLALTSPPRGYRLVGLVYSWTKATELLLCFMVGVVGLWMRVGAVCSWRKLVLKRVIHQI
jgi:hypothetical protein